MPWTRIGSGGDSMDLFTRALLLCAALSCAMLAGGFALFAHAGPA